MDGSRDRPEFHSVYFYVPPAQDREECPSSFENGVGRRGNQGGSGDKFLT